MGQDQAFVEMLDAWEKWWAAHVAGGVETPLWDAFRAAEAAWERAAGIPPRRPAGKAVA